MVVLCNMFLVHTNIIYSKFDIEYIMCVYHAHMCDRYRTHFEINRLLNGTT